jgi:hypothetical protein
VAEKWLDRKLVSVAYRPRDLGPRYGYGRPPHARLLEILRGGEEAYRRNLETIAGYREDLLRIAVQPSPEPIPTWINRWLLGLDSAAIYGLIRDRAPGAYVEIGSGMSTLFARRAIVDGGLSTRLTSIDPEPRREVEALCDRSVREPLESADLSIFDELGAGDMVFMDGSHQVFTDSDATVFFLEVLPRLPSGVLVGVHDILLPDDYLPEWTGYHWAEQYLLAAYLLGGGRGIELELACAYVTEYSDLHRVLDPVWRSAGLAGLDTRGFALWFATTAEA